MSKYVIPLELWLKGSIRSVAIESQSLLGHFKCI